VQVTHAKLYIIPIFFLRDSVFALQIDVGPGSYPEVNSGTYRNLHITAQFFL
jgi:hypothetical protein